MLKAPARYSPTANPERARLRTEQVLANMVDAGYLTEAEATQAKRLPVGRGAYPTAGLGGRYFADWVLDQVGATIGYVDRDLIVTTTLDPKLQRIAEGEVEAILAKYSDKRDADQAALVSLGADGRVLALDACLSDLHALGVVLDLRFKREFPPSLDELAAQRREKLRKIRGLS